MNVIRLLVKPFVFIHSALHFYKSLLMVHSKALWEIIQLLNNLISFLRKNNFCFKMLCQLNTNLFFTYVITIQNKSHIIPCTVLVNYVDDQIKTSFLAWKLKNRIAKCVIQNEFIYSKFCFGFIIKKIRVVFYNVLMKPQIS